MPVRTAAAPPEPVDLPPAMSLLELQTPQQRAVQRPAEVEEGPVEHKLWVLPPDSDRFAHLVTQMRWRLREGRGRCVYQLGVEDDGYPRGVMLPVMQESLRMLQAMASECGGAVSIAATEEGWGPSKALPSHIHHMREDVLEAAAAAQRRRDEVERDDGLLFVVEAHVQRIREEDEDGAAVEEVRVAVVGDEQAGKSTLVSVLTQGGLDDGEGLRRIEVFRHCHELETGHTSSVSAQLLGFRPDGEAMLTGEELGAATDWEEIVREAARVIMFLDTAGHERYAKTAIVGLLGRAPDCALLTVDSSAGLTQGTRERLGISLALRVPVAIVLNKADAAGAGEAERLAKQLDRLLRYRGADRHGMWVEEGAGGEEGEEGGGMRRVNPVSAARLLTAGDRFVPIFPVSCVTGAGLGALRSFLWHLPRRPEWGLRAKEPALVFLHDVYDVEDVDSLVVAGIVHSGSVRRGDPLLLGPDGLGLFRRVRVQSIHVLKCAARLAQPGDSVSFGLADPESGEAIPRAAFRRGMVLVAPDAQPRAAPRFQAEVLLLSHPSSVRPGAVLTLHVRSLRRAARVESVAPLTKVPRLVSTLPVLREHNHEADEAGERNPPPLELPPSSAGAGGTERPRRASSRRRYTEAPSLTVGERRVLTFHWCHGRSEFVVPGAPILVREGTIRAIGRITHVFLTNEEEEKGEEGEKGGDVRIG